MGKLVHATMVSLVGAIGTKCVVCGAVFNTMRDLGYAKVSPDGVACRKCAGRTVSVPQTASDVTDLF